jgi:NitT/TauT family transport system permease protein/taurine transport system permease protein
MLRTDTIVVGMLTIGLVGLLIDTAIRVLGRKFLPWSLTLSR